MQTSGGSSNINSGSEESNDSGLLATMKNFFTGKKEEAKELTPLEQWDAAHKAPEAAPEKTLNDYGDLFTPKQDPNVDPNAKKVDPFAAINRENLATAAKNIDFVGQVDEASFTAALSGDANALRAIINQAGQGAFTEAMAASNTLIQKRVDEALSSRVPELINSRQKEFEINKTVSNNPLLADPSLKPVRDALTQGIVKNNPTFDAAQVNEALTGYLQAMATSIKGKAGKEARMPSNERSVIAAGNF
jgi:hypothetical protein